MHRPSPIRSPEREQDRVLAAEFVLGTLDASERAQVRQRMRAEPAFAGLVRHWEHRLNPLHELTAPIAPPPELWRIILADLPAPPPAAKAPAGPKLPFGVKPPDAMRPPAGAGSPPGPKVQAPVKPAAVMSRQGAALLLEAVAPQGEAVGQSAPAVAQVAIPGADDQPAPPSAPRRFKLPFWRSSARERVEAPLAGAARAFVGEHADPVLEPPLGTVPKPPDKRAEALKAVRDAVSEDWTSLIGALAEDAPAGAKMGEESPKPRVTKPPPAKMPVPPPFMFTDDVVPADPLPPEAVLEPEPKPEPEPEPPSASAETLLIVREVEALAPPRAMPRKPGWLTARLKRAWQGRTLTAVPDVEITLPTALVPPLPEAASTPEPSAAEAETAKTGEPSQAVEASEEEAAPLVPPEVPASAGSAADKTEPAPSSEGPSPGEASAPGEAHAAEAAPCAKAPSADEAELPKAEPVPSSDATPVEDSVGPQAAAEEVTQEQAAEKAACDDAKDQEPTSLGANDAGATDLEATDQEPMGQATIQGSLGEDLPAPPSKIDTGEAEQTGANPVAIDDPGSIARVVGQAEGTETAEQEAGGPPAGGLEGSGFDASGAETSGQETGGSESGPGDNAAAEDPGRIAGEQAASQPASNEPASIDQSPSEEVASGSELAEKESLSAETGLDGQEATAAPAAAQEPAQPSEAEPAEAQSDAAEPAARTDEPSAPEVAVAETPPQAVVPLAEAVPLVPELAEEVASPAHAPQAAAAPGSTAGWRMAVALLTVVSVSLAGLLAYREWFWPGAGNYIAVLQGSSAPVVALRIDPVSGVVFARVLSAEPPEGKIYHLWLVTGQDGPVRLGRFSSGMAARSHVVLGLSPDALRTAEVNITLEPADASGASTPQGPVVFAGRLVPE